MINLGVMSWWTKPSKIEHILRDVYLWGLSSCILKKHFPKTKIVTDLKGKFILIDKLRLPFDEVDLSLEGFGSPRYNHVWAAGKIKAYSLQTEPFFHIDSDVIFLKSPPKHVLKSSLVASHEEFFCAEEKSDRAKCYPIYRYKTFIKFLPPPVVEMISGPIQKPYNMGIFGGNDISFIKLYCNAALECMTRGSFNQLIPYLKHGTAASIFFEQYFLGAYAHAYQKQVKSIVMKNSTRVFLHFIGNRKKFLSTQNFCKERLKASYPEVYENCRLLEKELVVFNGKTIQDRTY